MSFGMYLWFHCEDITAYFRGAGLQSVVLSHICCFCAVFLMLCCFLMPPQWSNVAPISSHMASAGAQQKYRNTLVHKPQVLCYYAWKIHLFSAHFL